MTLINNRQVYQTSQSSKVDSKGSIAQHRRFIVIRHLLPTSTPQGNIPEIFHTICYLFSKVRDKPFTALVLPFPKLLPALVSLAPATNPALVFPTAPATAYKH